MSDIEHTTGSTSTSTCGLQWAPSKALHECSADGWTLWKSPGMGGHLQGGGRSNLVDRRDKQPTPCADSNNKTGKLTTE